MVLSFSSTPSSNSEISLLWPPEKNPQGRGSFSLLQKTQCPFSALPWCIGLYSPARALPRLPVTLEELSHMLYCQGTAWPWSVVSACVYVGGEGQRGHTRAEQNNCRGEAWGRLGFVGEELLTCQELGCVQTYINKGIKNRESNGFLNCRPWFAGRGFVFSRLMHVKFVICPHLLHLLGEDTVTRYLTWETTDTETSGIFSPAPCW